MTRLQRLGKLPGGAIAELKLRRHPLDYRRRFALRAAVIQPEPRQQDLQRGAIKWAEFAESCDPLPSPRLESVKLGRRDVLLAPGEGVISAYQQESVRQPIERDAEMVDDPH